MGSVFGVMSLIFGIIGNIISLAIMFPMISFGFSYLAFIPYFPNIVAIICGVIGIKKDDSGLAKAGLILGCIGIGIAVWFNVIGLLR